ncbi:MAG: bifunctional 2-polyprenyl-6-hydroxyphenol methylase/3-demethylubiquinol 3-O-methyltransferase UbiG [Rhodospirillaceae bacterium]|nr:bifunctional 2-polyprenyl-6-hydroxyphenol methylase/3-demethylubiquinol 3-O-methyltransferase UbiG [Rhodospirillaceae bacterium]
MPTASRVGTSTGARSSADQDEIAKFSALADSWWDLSGAFQPLHNFNPSRIRFVRDRLAIHFGRDPLSAKPFAGLTLLDIGCGGGLIAEPMARLGFRVTGIDAAEKNVGVARVHAARSELDIAYECATPEELLSRGIRYDVVLALEVVEHVADVTTFLNSAAGLLAPKGALVAATLNRTLKALALAKIGAEYILRWVPAGTHDWRKFVRPSELAAGLRQGGLTVTELAGMSYDLFTDSWRTSKDLDVNYLALAIRR